MRRCRDAAINGLTQEQIAAAGLPLCAAAIMQLHPEGTDKRPILILILPSYIIKLKALQLRCIFDLYI